MSPSLPLSRAPSRCLSSCSYSVSSCLPYPPFLDGSLVLAIGWSASRAIGSWEGHTQASGGAAQSGGRVGTYVGPLRSLDPSGRCASFLERIAVAARGSHLSFLVAFMLVAAVKR